MLMMITPSQQQIISYGDITLDPNKTYYFNYKIESSSQFSISNIVLRNVDESLPTLPVDLNLQSQSGNLARFIAGHAAKIHHLKSPRHQEF